MSTAAWGQAPAPEAAPGGGAQIQSLDRLQAEQERLRELARRQPPAYDDQFLSADDGPLLGGEANPTDAEPPGLRYWLVETQLNWTQRQPSGAAPQHLSESGLRLQYQQETLSHGQWQVSADARRHSGDTALGAWGAFNAAAQSTSGARLTLRNLGLPLSPSSFADIGLGDLHSEVTDGLTRGQRLGGARPQLELVRIGTDSLKNQRRPVLVVRNLGDAHGRLDGALTVRDADDKALELVPEGAPVLPGQTRTLALAARGKDGATAPLRFPLRVSGTLDWDEGAFKIEATLP